MRIPDRLTSLVDEGIIEEVLRPLMSGKEAQVFLVRSEGEPRVAKVYKEAQDRTFKQRAEYTEGRATRNTRDQRAMSKRSRYGREQDEAAWRSAEVDMMYRLSAAGVRVPKPHHFVDGVLVMELITDAEGNPAPRVGELSLDRDLAIRIFDCLLAEVVRMLSVGVVHGDLSEFNVLLGKSGPVVIDFPQALNASGNQNARRILIRDVDNLQRFVARFDPNRRPLPYGQEMWQLYQSGELTAETVLTGRFRASEKQADTHGLLALVAEAERDERQRRQQLGQPMRGGSGQPRGGSGQPRGGQAGPPRQGQRGGGPPRPPRQPPGPIVEIRSTPRSAVPSPARPLATTVHEPRNAVRGISTLPPPVHDYVRPQPSHGSGPQRHSTQHEPGRSGPRPAPAQTQGANGQPDPAHPTPARRRRRRRKPGVPSAREP